MTNSSDTPRTLRRDIVFAFGLALACYMAWLIRNVLVLLYVSALFAVVLSPVVRSASRLRITTLWELTGAESMNAGLPPPPRP